MIRAERFVWRGLAALPLIAIPLFATGHFAGEEKWPGQTLAVIILAWPPAAIFFLGTSTLLRRRLATTRWLLLLAFYGVAGWIVIATAGRLIESDDANRAAGGWALMGLFVAPVALGLLALAGAHLRAQSKAKKDYYDGVLHIAHGKLAKAAEALEKHNEAHADDPRGLEWLALAKLLSNRYEEALNAVDRAIDTGKAKIGLWIKGDTLLSAGAAGEALAVYEACARKRPKPRYVAAAMGAALVQLRRLGDATKMLQSQKRWRSLPSVALTLGEALRLSGDSDAALKAYEAAALGATVEASLRGARYRAVMACALAHTGKLAEAEEAAQSALAADATNTTALSALALVQRRTGDLDGLEATLQRMLDASPPGVVRTLGDPEFTPLLTDERFRVLLGRAWLEQNRLLERIRRRAPTSNL
jgi:tetratricopeptide (TPR) repeat protein